MRGKTKRIISRSLLGFSLVLLIAGVFAVVFGILENRQLKATFASNPLEIEANLAKPGVYEGHFERLTGVAHHFHILLDTTPPYEGEEELMKVVGALSGKLEVLNAEGATLVTWELGAAPMTLWEGDAQRLTCAIADTHSVPSGDFGARLTVETPTQNLDRPYGIVGRYLPCGIEFMGCMIVTIAGVLSGALGLVFAFIGASVGRSAKRSIAAESAAHDAVPDIRSTNAPE